MSGLCLAATQAQAQKLSIQGDRFAVDGTPKFLTFISYFAAMGAPHVTVDLHLIRSLGFDGVRIWPNLDTGPKLMNGDGTLRPDELKQLLSILDQARLEHLVVDVTFTHEHISGMTAGTALAGIVAATNALRSYDNVLFDIQNERNVGDRRFMSEADVGRIFAAIKATHPARIATASNSPVDDAQYAANFTARLGLDVTAYHEPRASGWYTLGATQDVVRTMRANGRPAYLQEPNSTRDPDYRENFLAEYYLQAIVNAKLAGAAAWCFHTLLGVDFRDGTGPPFLEDRLRAFPQPEWTFVNSLNARVMLRASNGVNYLAAEAGGGYGVQADWTAGSPGSWQVFGIAALSGGPLVSGDRVAITAPDGTHFLQATGGGGSSLTAGSSSAGAWETFIIERSGSGAIRHSERVTLRAGETPFYMVANEGGGRTVSVNSAARGMWETFTLLFVTPHSAATAPAAATTAATTAATWTATRPVAGERAARLPPAASADAPPPAPVPIVERGAPSAPAGPRLVAIGTTLVDGVLLRTAALALGDDIHVVKPGDTLATLVVRRIGPDNVELVDPRSGRTFRIGFP